MNIWNGAAVLYARYRLGLVEADTQTTAPERACLTRHAAGRRSLVEIGVMHGATTALLRSVMAPEGVVTGIDRHLPGKLRVSFERLVAKHELARYPRGQAVLLREWSHDAARPWTATDRSGSGCRSLAGTSRSSTATAARSRPAGPGS